METVSYSGTASTPIYNPKYNIGDIVFNARSNLHILIENVDVGIFGATYHFRILENNQTGVDYCEQADKSKNLIKVG